MQPPWKKTILPSDDITIPYKRFCGCWNNLAFEHGEIVFFVAPLSSFLLMFLVLYLWVGFKPGLLPSTFVNTELESEKSIFSNLKTGCFFSGMCSCGDASS